MKVLTIDSFELTDKGWYKIHFDYLANGGESQIVLGNLLPKEKIVFKPL